MKRPAGIAATVLGIGFFPAAPGTLASAVAALAYRFVLHDLPWPWYLLLLAGLTLLGVAASAAYAAGLKQHDPGRIVIDEVCGQLAAFFLVPSGWLPVGLAFVFFRFFDIIKPYPIRRLERLPGGWGIMADDIGAGAAACALAHLVGLWI
jgi:phosphatidylglycerophosphatase A